MFLIIYLHCHVCHFLTVNIPLRLDKGLHNVFRSTRRKLKFTIITSSVAHKHISAFQSLAVHRMFATSTKFSDLISHNSLVAQWWGICSGNQKVIGLTSIGVFGVFCSETPVSLTEKSSFSGKLNYPNRNRHAGRVRIRSHSVPADGHYHLVVFFLYEQAFRGESIKYDFSRVKSF